MMRLSVPAPARCSSIKHRGSMHKFIGLHHHNVLATAPDHSRSPAAAPGAQISRSSSGPLLPSNSSYGILTCTVRGGMGPNSLVTVRCLPIEEHGLLQLSGNDPGDVTMGDEGTEPNRPSSGTTGQEQQKQQSSTEGDVSIDKVDTGGVAPASSEGSNPLLASASEGEGEQTGGDAAAMQAGGVEAGRGGSNAPDDNPAHVKQVVQEETLGGQV